MGNEAIVGVAILVTLAVGLVDPVKSWIQSLKRRGEVSAVLLLAMAAPFFGGVRDLTESEATSVLTSMRIVRGVVMLVIFALTAIRLARSSAGFARSSTSMILMLMYALLAIISSAYSGDPLVTAWKGFEVLVFVLVGFYACGEIRRPEDLISVLDVLWLSIFFLVVSALCGVVMAPERALVRLDESSALVVQGVAPPINPNTLTQFGALLGVACVVKVVASGRSGRNAAATVVATVGFLAMLIAHSRTSIVAAAIAVSTIMYLAGRRALSLILVAAMAAATALSAAVISYMSRGQSHELLLSMSGRTIFWDEVWRAIREAPILGHGFYASQRAIFGVSSVDNAYLEVLLGLGVVGFMVFSGAVGALWIAILTSRPPKGARAVVTQVWLQMVGLFVLLVIRSLTGPSFQVMHWNLLMFMLLGGGAAAMTRMRFDEGSLRETKARAHMPPYENLLR